MGTIYLYRWLSPVGEMLLGSYGDKLCICDWACRDDEAYLRRIQRRLGATCVDGLTEVIQRAVNQLTDYFCGSRREFDVQLLMVGTDFQRRVWTALQDIPYGSTISYGELARRIGSRKSVRAVAHSNAKNPISIFVPCHRVIGSNNKLVGYTGGLQAKQALLQIEGVCLPLNYEVSR